MAVDVTIDELLQRLVDAGRPAPERQAALRELQAAKFSDAAFEGREAEFLAALRSASTAEDLDLRLSVLHALCTMKDRDTQQRLIAGLDDPAKELAPPEDALRLLGYDIHAGVFPVARRLAAAPPNLGAEHEALRLLGSDPGSVDLFAKLLADPARDAESRFLAGTCLRSLAPDRFVAVAKQVIPVATDDTAVRTFVLKGLVESPTSPEDDELRTAATQVVEERTSTSAMKGYARTLVSRTPGRQPPAGAPD